MTPVPENFAVKIEGMCCVSIMIPGSDRIAQIGALLVRASNRLSRCENKSCRRRDPRLALAQEFAEIRGPYTHAGSVVRYRVVKEIALTESCPKTGTCRSPRFFQLAA
jgi:hypothetical protein